MLPDKSACKPTLPLCARCGGAQSLVAGRVTKLRETGFVDFWRCDDCGAVTTLDRQEPGEKRTYINRRYNAAIGR